MVLVVVNEPTTLQSARIFYPPFSSLRVNEMVRSLFKIKMVACYDEASTSGGEGAGPQPAHAGSGSRSQDGDSLCN